jgi:hypothetical protein
MCICNFFYQVHRRMEVGDVFETVEAFQKKAIADAGTTRIEVERGGGGKGGGGFRGCVWGSTEETKGVGGVGWCSWWKGI